MALQQLKEQAIGVQDGGYEKYHNHYPLEEFISEDTGEGTLTDIYGQRVLRVNEDVIVGLHAGLEHDLDDAANLVMYKCGQEWALKDMKRFNERMRHEFGGGKKDIWQMNKRFVFETWWWPFTTQGWGGWSLDLSFEDKNLTFVEIRNSAVAKSMEQVGKPVCHLYAGLFAGVMSYFDRKERESIEVQCYSMGNDRCKFMVGDGKQVNAAEFWRQEGASADDIRARL